MRLGVFVACAGRQDGGPETYERRLVEGLVGLDQDHELHVFCLSRAAAKAFDVNGAAAAFHVLRPSIRWISLPVSLPISLLRHRVQLYHATFVPPPFSPVDYVFTMHDVTPFVRPDYYPPAVGHRLRALIRGGIRGAKMILCISEHVRDTTAELFGISPDRLAVVHHGVDPRFHAAARLHAPQAVREAYGLEQPYLLYVGKLEHRKNILRLLQAYRRFQDEVPDAPRLVLAGKRTWQFRQMDEALQRLDPAGRVRELGYVPDAILPALYSAAEALVFPTLWEGFGLPVLEAMACGTPVITSRVSCLPEIAGDAALLIDPESIEDIAGALHRLHTDAPLRASLRTRGIERAARFTWELTARRTLEVYQRAAAM